jgi:hypothetical protein
MRQIHQSLCLTIVLVLVVGCGSFLKTTYVPLNESKDLYDLAMTAVANLQKQGSIDQVKRDEINKVAKIYKEAHNLAVDALATYKITKLAADKDKVIVAISTAASKWVSVAALINAIKPGSVPTTFPK